MPIPRETDHPRRGEPTGCRPGEPEPSGPSSPSKTAASRRRRDLVGWVALGLTVTTALALVARASVEPQRRSTGTTTTLERTTLTTTATTRLARTDTVHDQLPTTPKPSSSETVPTVVVQPTVPVTVASTPDEPGPSTSVPHLPAPARPVSTPAETPGLSGTLQYPDDVATSFPFTSSSGLAAVRATWSGGGALEMSLRCGSVTVSGTGTHGISLVVAGHPSSCTVSIALRPDQRGSVAYTLDVQVPSGDAAARTTT